MTATRQILAALVLQLGLLGGVLAQTTTVCADSTGCDASAEFSSVRSPPTSELKILRVTPEGLDVPAAQQIVFEFDRPVVPIGQMARKNHEIPVTIEPELNCQWRWLNTSALACQLGTEHAMQQATRYAITMLVGIENIDGARLAQAVRHSFTTARPRVTYTRFVNWLSPGTPLIQITFDQPVTRSSAEAAISMQVSSNAVGAIATPDNLPRSEPFWAMPATRGSEAGVDDRFTAIDGEEARRVWIIEPRQELPLGDTISLIVEPGLQSSEGSERGIEARTIIEFDTFPEFKFLGVRCTPKGAADPQNFFVQDVAAIDKPHMLATKCAPLKTVALLFSAPILTSTVKQFANFSPNLAGDRKHYDPWENHEDWSQLASPHRKDALYQQWLPGFLRANQQYLIRFDRDNFVDEFGRRLPGPIEFAFQTSHREPNLRVSHHHAVLEKDVASDVPLYVTNLDRVDIRYDKLGNSSQAVGLTKQRDIDDVEDLAFAVPMNVRQLLGDDSGAIFAQLHPQPAPPDWYRDPQIMAQVTPYQVHYKLGHFNSLAWVTDFATGQPISAATVSLHTGRIESLTELRALDITNTTDRNGIAALPGLAEIDSELELVYGHNGDRLFLKVEYDGDIAILPVDYDYSVRGNGVHSHLRRRGGHAHAWGTTAQGIYKLGDTIEYKIYLREQSNRHWVAPDEGTYVLRVSDPTGKTVFEKDNIILNEFGAFDGELNIGAEGAVGWYRFELEPAKTAGQEHARFTWTPLSVLVSDFTASPFAVRTELNGENFSANDAVRVTSIAAMHAGGPFSAAEVRVTAQLRAKPFTTSNPLTKNFVFGSDARDVQHAQSGLLDVRTRLNDAGEVENTFVLPESEFYYGSLFVESAVKDDRGKFIAATASADFAGRDRYVGLRNTRWLYQQGETAKLQTVVVDTNGELPTTVPISITISRRETKAARVKGPGNAYLTQNTSQWVAESTCETTSELAPVACEFTPKHAGYYQFTASIADTQQRAHKTTLFGWVTGRGAVVWDQTNDATLQIIPEKTEYQIGETARYLVKNPFPGAQALVSVERYGVLDSWVQELETSTPVIEVPIKPDYLPGFYLSVVTVSGRVTQPLGAGKVDLGKPSYRLGYVRGQVSDPYKQLAIKVETDKAVYKPRAKVSAEIHVAPRAGDSTDRIEIAVAVVDEAVLAMNRNGPGYYDPYRGFNRLDTLDVNNYSLISRLVGRQKFEKKGANPGGGGGAADLELRNQFKYVSYWNPSIMPDAHGNASIEFQVPDNLTGWRIFALAVTPNDRMGIGDANIKVNRPTEIRPVMPNQLTAGDSVQAGFSIMNRTERARDLVVTATVDGPLVAASKTAFDFKLSLPAYQRESVWLPITTDGDGALKFKIRGGDISDADALEYEVPVRERRALETAASYATTQDKRVFETVKVPENIFVDGGDITTTLSPTVIGNLEGAFDYIKNYPHRCWEQRLTKAVFASAFNALQAYLEQSVAWPNSASDIESALSAAQNFQADNGGMTYWIPSSEYVSPYLSAYTATAFNWLRRAGHDIPLTVESQLHEYLLRILRRNDFPKFYTKGMASTVRAVALAALAEHDKVARDDIDRYARHVPQMDLFGKSQFLAAALRTPGVAPRRIRETVNTILGHASQSGGKFQFNEAWDDSYQYILATPLRSNCAILTSLLDANQAPGIRDLIKDIPFKLVRSITQARGNRDHWENTQENAFCLNALVDYAFQYEADNPNMSVSVAFGDDHKAQTDFTRKTDSPVALSRKLNATDLGKSIKVEIEKTGAGRLYYNTRVSYDLKEDNPARINAGIEIRREYSVERNGHFVLLEDPVEVRRGDVVRIDLFVAVPSARHFVVVHDPIPGGLEPINADLATSSVIDAQKGEFNAAAGSWFYEITDWSYYGRYFWSFYHQELRHDAARFYADYLPAGNYHLSYSAQAIAEGKFSIMASRAEEMYDPDIYGRGLPATLQVGP